MKFVISILSSIAMIALLLGIIGLKDDLSSKKRLFVKKAFLKKFATMVKKHTKVVYIVMFGLSVFIVYLISKSFLFGSIVSICLLILTSDIRKNLERNRYLRLNNQLIRLLNDISMMLSSGKTLNQIFIEIPKNIPRPLKSYLSWISNSLKSGQDLDLVLTRFSEKAKNKNIDLLVDCIRLNHKLGGDMTYILQDLTKSIRHDIEKENRENTLTMQSRLSGILISAFPILALLVLSIFTGDMIDHFFSSFAGNVCMVVGGFFEILGILSIRKIIARR